MPFLTTAYVPRGPRDHINRKILHSVPRPTTGGDSRKRQVLNVARAKVLRWDVDDPEKAGTFLPTELLGLFLVSPKPSPSLDFDCIMGYPTTPLYTTPLKVSPEMSLFGQTEDS